MYIEWLENTMKCIPISVQKKGKIYMLHFLNNFFSEFTNY